MEVQPGQTGTSTAQCPEGMTAVSGGWGGFGLVPHFSTRGAVNTIGDSWVVAFTNNGSEPQSGQAVVYCAPLQ
ncbi:hypothetical protein [Streptomyces sp. NPDC089799]|uniref:hypothetical protein n=1 Tax=Streptomyces sp. NPDC089799 TaxID=3155066 RepID=UPI003426BF05